MSFAAAFGATFSPSPSVTSLPAYTARAARPSTAGAVRNLTEHIFEIKKDKLVGKKEKKAWATLKLASSARSSSSLPTFLEGDKITGSVTLDLSGGENILGISILIRGQIVTGPQTQDRLCFLDISTPLWFKGMDNPRQRDSLASYNGKSSGEYQWPFSISLPSEVMLPDPSSRQHGATQTYRLPQTFLERTTIASVYYELFVHIARSTFRVDNKLQTMFIYVPAIRPDPASRLRQLAYRQNGPVPGVGEDPEGWHTIQPVEIKGTLFNTRRVTIQAILSLAKPLSYTRGSVIPCSLTYLCDDTQALSLVCTPVTNHVCLHRQASYSQAHAAAEHAHHAQRFSAADSVIGISRAVWWPVDDGRGSGTRRFDGEIHLPKSLKPSSRVSHFSISYFVVMLPFQVTGFAPEDNSKPHLRQEVQIATMFPKGPKPRVYTPPSYEIIEVGDNMHMSPSMAFV